MSGNQVDNRSELLQLVIRNAMMNQFIYSSASFDNAKDTASLHYAANENAEMLVQAVEYKLKDRIEELLMERVENALIKGKFVVRIGSKLYQVSDMLATSPNISKELPTDAQTGAAGISKEGENDD